MLHTSQMVQDKISITNIITIHTWCTKKFKTFQMYIIGTTKLSSSLLFPSHLMIHLFFFSINKHIYYQKAKRRKAYREYTGRQGPLNKRQKKQKTHRPLTGG